MLNTIKNKVGPGLLFAASSVGVSHLIQATRGGAEYGIGIVLIIVLICLVKYPIFLFSARYTAITGETILDGYERLGKWILLLVFIVHLLELPFAIAGVSLATIGIIKNSTNLLIGDASGSILLVFLSIITLTLGRYPLLENLSKFFVLIFLFCILAATMSTVAGSTESTHSILADNLNFDTQTFLFLIAIAGWMPAGAAGAVGISLWVHAKAQRQDKKLTVREVCFDFNLGYIIVIITACCFAFLGSYIFFATGTPLEGDSSAFAEQLIDLLTEALGSWIYYIIVIGANVVMISSLLILVDLLPRLSTTVALRLMPDKFGEEDRPKLYLFFIIYELVSLIFILLLLFDSFTTFIDLVTSIGFLAAPIIAYLNHKVIFSPRVPLDLQPSIYLKACNIFAIILFSLVALIFLFFKFTS